MGVTPDMPTNSEEDRRGNTLYKLEGRTSMPPPARQASRKAVVRLEIKSDTLSEAEVATDGGKGPEQSGKPCDSRFKAAVVSVAQAR